MLAGAAVLFAFVMGLFALAFLKPGWRWRESAGRNWMLYGGLVMPVMVLAALLVFALTRGEGLLAHPRSEGLVRVSAEGQRWQWVFRYPGTAFEGETRDVLHVPAGRPVDVEIVSADVIHSFWVPRLGGKMDAIPGHTNTLRIEADEEGTYGGICSEYCGFGHAVMNFSVIAHAPEAYEALLATGFETAEGGQ